MIILRQNIYETVTVHNFTAHDKFKVPMDHGTERILKSVCVDKLLYGRAAFYCLWTRVLLLAGQTALAPALNPL